MKHLYIPISVLLFILLLVFSYTRVFRSSSAALSYKNSGGLMGLCDNLEINRDGEYRYTDDCRHSSKSGSLSETDKNQLNLLTHRYGQINYSWDENKAKGSADGFVGSLELAGNGTSSSEAATTDIKLFALKVISEVK